jgi:membrane protease YdiL (CAAX protease family)
MSAVVTRPPTRQRTVLEWAAVATALVLLLTRSGAASMPLAAWILLGVYSAVGWVSVGSADPIIPRRPAWPALAIGVCAIGVAAFAHAPAPPVPRTSWTLPLGMAAAVAEEAFFRGLLYRALSRAGTVVAVAGTTLAFAAIHVPAYGPAALWVDLGAGLLLSWQRWASGGWGVPAATHAVANLLAVMP